MKKVSIVVPVYNAEKCIENTIECLLNQTLKDIEIILVNDGSSDESLKVLREYESKNPERIVVIDQENSGPGGARNNGIKAASGEYIGFLDADDTQDYMMYERMYNKAISNDFDMVVCDTISVYPNERILVKSGIDNDLTDCVSIKKAMIYSYAVIWNKIVKRDILKSTPFPCGLWYEDVEFLFKLFPKVKSIGVINESFCNYIQNDNSITYTFNSKIYDLVKIMDNILKYYKKNGLYDEYKYELEYSYVRYLYGTFVRRISKTKNKKEYNNAVNIAIEKIKSNFPNFKKNVYLKQAGAKNLYLRNFNKFIAKGVYLFEKNKMNYKLQDKIESGFKGKKN